MSKLTFYSNPYSRARIVRWMLEELDVPYELEVLEFDGSIKSEDYLAINPMGKVPAIVHGDTVVTETVAICAYLADQFPEKKLAPPVQSPLRGTYYRWLFFVAGPLEMASTARAFNWPINDEHTRAIGCGHIEDAANTLEASLAKKTYICGDHFTAADLVLGSYLGWQMMQKNLEERPVFVDYVNNLQSRPAAKRANDLDNALVK